MDSQTRDVKPSEMRTDAANAIQLAPDDILVWLEGERTVEAAARNEAFAAADNVVANRHDARTTKFKTAIDELRTAREKLEHFKEVVVSRVMIALQEAKAPPWKATHRHYKGHNYRVTGIRDQADGDELVEGVDYDDRSGHKFFLTRARFESRTDSGKLRYQPLYPGDPSSSADTMGGE